MSLLERPIDAVLELAAGEARGAGQTLDALPIGVRAILGEPDQLDPTIIRLLEMGFTAGAEIVVTRRAMGADPIEVRLRGTRLCLRRADAAQFPVRLLRAPGPQP